RPVSKSPGSGCRCNGTSSCRTSSAQGTRKFYFWLLLLSGGITIVPAALVLVMAALLVGKEFVLESWRSRLWMNVGVAVLATALVGWLIQVLIVLPW
ncbi:MAG: hypothetical protein LAT50_15170, partial [Ectothiorhodospiraceae bacterium]|nr:hypothetical protein [Ectothiorhodospiraceae bacterium]